MDRLRTMFLEGGAQMYFVVGIGFVTLATAFWFAARPSAVHVGFLKWMSRALLYGTVASVFFGAATVLHVVAKIDDATTRLGILFQGLAESCAPVILGGAFLALISMLAAVGQRRLDARKS